MDNTPRYALQMRIRLLALLLLLPICVEAGNAKIAALVQTFEGRSLYSGSSFWPAIKLPKDASPSQVCDTLLKSGFDQFSSYRITTAETVRVVLDHVPVGPDGKRTWVPTKEPITATLIQTDDGDKVVFMDFKEGGWRTAVYSIPTGTLHTAARVGGSIKALSECTHAACMSGTNKVSKAIAEPIAAGYRREAAPQPER